MSELEAAIEDLMLYVHHNCSLHQTDSPDDDFCTCDVKKAVLRVRAALAQPSQSTTKEEK